MSAEIIEMRGHAPVARAGRDVDQQPCTVIILPVVRVERFGEDEHAEPGDSSLPSDLILFDSWH